MEGSEAYAFYLRERGDPDPYKEIRDHERRIREGNMGVFGLSTAFIVGFLIFIFVIRYIENRDY